MKTWLVKNADVDIDAGDDVFMAAAVKNLADGSLTPENVVELTKSVDDEEADDVKSILKDLTDVVKSLKADSTKTVQDESDDEGETKDADIKGKQSSAPEKKAIATRFEKSMIESGVRMPAYADGEKGISVRVKEAADQYDSTKSALHYPEGVNDKGVKHPLAGQRVIDDASGRQLDTSSDRDKAVAGAWAKFEVQRHLVKSRRLAFESMKQHDKELLLYAMENEEWGGATDGGPTADIKGKLTPTQQKALIDDASSGGLEAAPIVFDDQVIKTPLLNGELYPLVSVKNLDRGRRIEGVAVANVTAAWGGVDATAISLFNTASYVSAFDTTIFRWEGAIQLGLDFLSDTPVDFGAIITEQYGERLLEDLDDVIATGNGTTQPEGVMNKSGATSVSWGATTSLGNYESTRFGVAKQEHKGSVKASACWIGTETSYQRAKAIPVGASDARRLGGMDYDSYTWMQRPYKINESLTNAQIAYVILARYRMYRRRGLTMRSSTEGDTLIRNNELLMVATARYGGQLERGAVCARTTTAPT